MTPNPKLLVFTDLDGTLIDHETYDWSPARPAISALKKIGAGIILSSSKTAAEMVIIRAELGLEAWPAIVENGAGLLPSGELKLPEATIYEKLRSILEGMPPLMRSCYTGFGDLTKNDVSEATGLSLDRAALAKARCFSEPGVWDGSEAMKLRFLTALADQGITAQQGGRFLTLSFGTNKADQMRILMESYKPAHTIALGDAPNDIEMLEAAHHPVVIANPHRAPLPALKNEGSALRTEKPGPEGWNAAILSLIDRLGLQRTI